MVCHQFPVQLRDSASLFASPCDNRGSQQAVFSVLAARTERRAIIARRSSRSFGGLLNFFVPAPGSAITHPATDQEEQ